MDSTCDYEEALNTPLNKAAFIFVTPESAQCRVQSSTCLPQVVNSAEFASYGHILLRNMLLFCVLLLIYSHNCSH